MIGVYNKKEQVEMIGKFVKKPLNFENVLELNAVALEGDYTHLENQIQEGIIYCNAYNKNDFSAIYKMGAKKVLIPHIADSRIFLDKVARKVDKNLPVFPRFFHFYFPDLYFVVRFCDSSFEHISIVTDYNLRYLPIFNSYDSYIHGSRNFLAEKVVKALEGIPDLSSRELCVGTSLKKMIKEKEQTEGGVLNSLGEILNTLMSSEPNSDLTLSGEFEVVLQHIKRTCRRDIVVDHSLRIFGFRTLELFLISLWFDIKFKESERDFSNREEVNKFYQDFNSYIEETNREIVAEKFLKEVIEVYPFFEEIYSVKNREEK